MAGPIQKMLQTIRGFWRRRSRCETAAPAVVLHDPTAQRPHNLDDPFFDLKVQARFGDVIASAGRNRHRARSGHEPDEAAKAPGLAEPRMLLGRAEKVND
jgi:hypothetical protein